MMVVVFVIVKVLVSRDSVGKIDFAREAAIDQDLHRAIHRRVSDARIIFREQRDRCLPRFDVLRDSRNISRISWR